ncbi:hypothetical protein T09_4341 [Trichinella sp. T9]|nr:hypothetical protein T09_4341 [Trichinella sp. T9]
MREIFLLIVYFYSLPAASRFDNSCFKCKSYYPGFYVVVKQQRGREGSKLIKVKKDFLQPTITTTFQLDNAYHHNSAPHNTKGSFFLDLFAKIAQRFGILLLSFMPSISSIKIAVHLKEINV